MEQGRGGGEKLTTTGSVHRQPLKRKRQQQQRGSSSRQYSIWTIAEEAEQTVAAAVPFDQGPILYPTHLEPSGEYCVRHRTDGEPAVSMRNYKAWYAYNQVHRDGGLPAIESPAGNMWLVNGQCHRDGGLPSTDYGDGAGIWCVRDQLHREGDLPAVVRKNGDVQWWWRGKAHRNRGLPAIMAGHDDWIHWCVHYSMVRKEQSQWWAVHQQQLVRLCALLSASTDDERLAEDIAVVVLGPCLMRNLRVHWSQ